MTRAAGAFAARRAFVDTSSYFALSDRRETNHTAAIAIQARLIGERWRLYTTNFIVAETHALLLIRLGYQFALRFLEGLEQSPTTVIRVSPSDEQRALAIIRRYDDKAFSLTDATSIAVMERLDLHTAFTFDRNFAQYGFTSFTAR